MESVEQLSKNLEILYLIRDKMTKFFSLNSQVERLCGIVCQETDLAKKNRLIDLTAILIDRCLMLRVEIDEIRAQNPSIFPLPLAK